MINEMLLSNEPQQNANEQKEFAENLKKCKESNLCPTCENQKHHINKKHSQKECFLMFYYSSSGIICPISTANSPVL